MEAVKCIPHPQDTFFHLSILLNKNIILSTYYVTDCSGCYRMAVNKKTNFLPSSSFQASEGKALSMEINKRLLHNRFS